MPHDFGEELFSVLPPASLSDRKKLAIEIKTTNPHWSNRKIAELLNCSYKTIARDLAEWEAENGTNVQENGTNVPPIPRTDKKAIAEAYKEDRKAGLEDSRKKRIENIAAISEGNKELEIRTLYLCH